MSNKYTICLTGGGTGGSVTPLLALADHLLATQKIKRESLVWLGSKKGLEKNIVSEKGIDYKGIASGKFRRYFSLANFFDPLFIVAGFLESLFFLIVHRPKIIISAGSFVAVPVVIAGWCLRIPTLVHQMDVRPGLANKLMAPFASLITVTFEKSLSDYGAKAQQVGNTVRTEIKNALALNRNGLYQKYHLNPGKPTILVVGGGTGAQAINQLLIESLPELKKFCQIIHQTGAGKKQGDSSAEYLAFDFISAGQLAECFALADLVVTRAGLGFISELAHLSKPCIIIPIPKSHQEDNAELLKANHAALVLNQKTLTPEQFVSTLRNLLNDGPELAMLARNINSLIKTDAEIKLTEIITKYIQ